MEEKAIHYDYQKMHLLECARKFHINFFSQKLKYGEAFISFTTDKYIGVHARKLHNILSAIYTLTFSIN